MESPRALARVLIRTSYSLRAVPLPSCFCFRNFCGGCYWKQGNASREIIITRCVCQPFDTSSIRHMGDEANQCVEHHEGYLLEERAESFETHVFCAHLMMNRPAVPPWPASCFHPVTRSPCCSARRALDPLQFPTHTGLLLASVVCWFAPKYQTKKRQNTQTENNQPSKQKYQARDLVEGTMRMCVCLCYMLYVIHIAYHMQRGLIEIYDNLLWSYPPICHCIVDFNLYCVVVWRRYEI